MKKTRVIAAAAALVLVLSSCGTNKALKQTAMEIGSVKVTAGDIATITELLRGSNEFDVAKGNFADDIENIFKRAELGKAMGIELTQEDKDSAVQMRAQVAQQAGGYSAFDEFLNANGSSMEFINGLYEASAYASKVSEKITEELNGAEATSEEIEKYYNDNYLCAKHILIDAGEDKAAAEKLANEILERAKNGEDFDAMAKEYSTDPGLETNPQGYVFTAGEMVQPFEDGVKALKPGEFGICESSFGYHVLLRLELPAYDSEASAMSTVASNFETYRKDTRLDELCEEKGIKVVVYDDAVAAITAEMLKSIPNKENTAQ